jgi:DNA-binding MarR family transcriptional regulator
MIKGAPDGSERAISSDLAQRLQLAQSSVTELVKRAELAGLSKRQACGTAESAGQPPDCARPLPLSL